jgi:hypothetical protein
MATRLYLYRTVTMPYSPAVNAGWTNSTGNGYVLMMPNKNYGLTVVSAAVTSGTSGAAAPKKLLSQVYISQPLIAQTINSGSTINVQIRINGNTTSGVTSHVGFMYARVINADGTVASEIGNVASGGASLGTSATNRTFTLTLGSNVTITDYQRIQIELGTSFVTGSQAALTGTITSVMSISTGDLPVDNTTTTALVPWIEFSQTLLFAKGMMI